MGPSGFDRCYGYGRIDVINSLDLVNRSCESDLECDDHNACTTDICNTGTGECSYSTSTCDDGKACTDDFCNPGTGECVFIDICDDINPCTTDSCTSSGCVFQPITNCIDSDGCCPPSCNFTTDDDCPCSTTGDSCESDPECCSGKCLGKPGFKTCK